MDDLWTIVELAELAAEALAAPETAGQDSGAVRGNGRVRDVPNERLIRWYSTVGLVDPPLSRRGRVARYGRRHLLQLVAVKRRQAEGRSLAEIQAELAGQTDEALAAVAQLPALGPVLVPARPAVGGSPAPSAAPDRFWARQPGQPVADAPPAAMDSNGAEIPPAGLVHGLRLAPGVMLLLDGVDRQPGPEDMTGIANAARPLLRELARLGLGVSGPHHPAETDQPEMGAGCEH